MTRPRLHLLSICLAALGVRLIAVWSAATSHPASWFFTQATELAALAENLRAGQGLSSPFGGHTGPSAFLAPGYPAIVAAAFALFQPYSIASAVALMLLQTLFGTLTVLIVMRFASRFGTRVANLAGILCALSPLLLFLPTLFWETGLSSLLAIALVALTVHSSDAEPQPRCMPLGLLSAVALMVNPSLLTIVVACFLWILYRTRRVAPLAGVLVCLLLSTPWAVRNQRQLHAFIPLRDNFGYELWQGNRPGSHGFFSSTLHPNANAGELLRLETLGEVAYMKEKSQLAEKSIETNPATFAALSAKRALYFWTGCGEHPAIFIIVPLTLISILGLAGLMSLWRARNNIARLLIVTFALFPVPYYITHPDFRFRLVLEPILDVLAAYFLVRIFGSGLDLQHVAEPDAALRNPSR